MTTRVTTLLLVLALSSNVWAQDDTSKQQSIIRALKKADWIEKSNPRLKYSTFPKFVESGNTTQSILMDVVEGVPLYSNDLSLSEPLLHAKLLPLTSYIEMHLINELWNGGSLSLELSGENQTIGHGEGARATHSEFSLANITYQDNPIISHHGTAVAGVISAEGIQTNVGKGSSYGANIVSYNRYMGDIFQMDLLAKNGAVASNHSYGGPAAWSYCSITGKYIWNSIGTADTNILFGRYDSFTTIPLDTLAYLNPHYTVVQAAGNSKTTGPNSDGTTMDGYHLISETGAGNCGPVYTDLRYPNSGGPSYDTIVTRGTAKNIITVGMIVANEGGYNGAENVDVDYRSSAGPTDDGRIKPDIVAVHATPGPQALFVPSHTTDDSYGYVSGTSAAAGVVTGIVGLLNELWIDLTSESLRSSEVKALLITSAWESGANDGPDYEAGWGVVNAKAAAALLQLDGGSRDLLKTVNLTDGESIEIPVYSNTEQPLKITASWTDPAGTELSPLVNDIDIRLRRESDDFIFEPWILDPNNPSAPATKGDNYLDNVEQILIDSPGQEVYTLIITHKANLVSGANVATANHGLIGSQLVSVAISGQEDSTLPVEIASFDLTIDARDVSLNWATSSELNNAGFMVQHKQIGGEIWNDVQFIEGYGTTEEVNYYSYRLENIDVGQHAFRLRQIDFDGSASLTAVLIASIEAPGSFVIDSAYPNPFNPSTKLGFSVNDPQQVRASLYNEVGQRLGILFNGYVPANQQYTIDIDGADLPSGNYLVRLEGKDESVTQRIVLIK